METISKSSPVAKRNHVCDYCGLPIIIGEKYDRLFIKFDGVYVWKNHILCRKIAYHLDMFDNCDEGLTSEDFQESIKNEYAEIRRDKMNEDDYPIPSFMDQLEFVKHYHSIK